MDIKTNVQSVTYTETKKQNSCILLYLTDNLATLDLQSDASGPSGVLKYCLSKETYNKWGGDESALKEMNERSLVD